MLITQFNDNWNVILSFSENSKQRKDHPLNLYEKRRKTMHVAVKFCENLVKYFVVCINNALSMNAL